MVDPRHFLAPRNVLTLDESRLINGVFGGLCCACLAKFCIEREVPGSVSRRLDLPRRIAQRVDPRHGVVCDGLGRRWRDFRGHYSWLFLEIYATSVTARKKRFHGMPEKGDSMRPESGDRGPSVFRLGPEGIVGHVRGSPSSEFDREPWLGAVVFVR